VISPGCTNCYAMRLAHRLELMGQPKYAGTTRMSGGRAKWNRKVKLYVSALDIPKRWTVGRTIFVNSMSDLFHEQVPLAFIQKAFATMVDAAQHTFQICHKAS
jgi:protein gp37